MAKWEKLLLRMVADQDPRGYTYSEAASVLAGIGFAAPSKPKGSHRLWRLKRQGCSLVVVGLVEKGHGPLKPVYIKDMVATLQKNGLLPQLPEDDALDD